MEIDKIYPQARINANGDLLFPKRGDPPKAIPGYIRDPGDKFVFHPILASCKFRNTIWTKVCGGMIQKHTCTLYNIPTSVCDCLNCKERKES